MLLEVTVGPGVHERQRSTVSSRRKPVAGENTCSEASVTGGSGCRWSLHEGGWAKSFRVDQWRKRGVGAVVLVVESRRRQRAK
jgi:hypothetical protein